MRDKKYLDTAAICSSARNAVLLPTITTALSGPLPTIPGYEFFFAPNATAALRYFISFFGGKQQVALNIDNWGPSVVQQVKSLVSSINSSQKQKKICIEVNTLMHWLTGEFRHELLHNTSDGCDIEILDAVQAFGNLQANELKKLFDRKNEHRVILGCLQKWVGSPVPLGFLAIPTSLFDQHDELAVFLGRCEYIGPDIMERHIITDFPDTYSSILSPYLVERLALALGYDPVATESLRAFISNSYSEMSIWLRTKFDLPQNIKSRGIVHISANESNYTEIVNTLKSKNFVFSEYNTFTDGSNGVRLSAPMHILKDDKESKEKGLA